MTEQAETKNRLPLWADRFPVRPARFLNIKLAHGSVSRARLAQLYMGRGAIYLTWRKKQKARRNPVAQRDLSQYRDPSVAEVFGHNQ